MKNVRVHVLLSTMFACIPLCYAMEEGYVAGSEPMELEKSKGKRSAQGQPEGEAALKKEKTEAAGVPYKPLIKELIEKRYVVNTDTGDYDIKPEIVEKIIINNPQAPEFFTHKTFEQLIKDRMAQGLYYLLATITGQKDNVEEIECFDGYSLLQHVFTVDYKWDQFGVAGSRDIRPHWRRYNSVQNSPIFGKDPLTQEPIFGPIKFYMIKNINDPAFIFVGSDYDLHSNQDVKIRAHFRRLLEANKPNELVILEADDENERDNKVSERSANQIMLGIEYYKEKNYDEALHYYRLAQEDENGDYTTYEYENNDHFNAPEDSTLLITLLYYTQKKYDEAFKEIENYFDNSQNKIFGPYLILSRTIHERLGGEKFDICGLLGKEFYKEKKYAQAQFCLKHVYETTPEIQSLLKTIGEQQIQEEWQRIEKEGE